MTLRSGSESKAGFSLATGIFELGALRYHVGNLSILRPPCCEGPDTDWPILGSLVGSVCP